jgi:SNF2 family DNA or RNA helicase
LHRLGQKGSVIVTYLLANGTIDEEIYSLIERKRSVVSLATDGLSSDSEEDGALSLLLNLMGV